MNILWGLLRWHNGKECACQYRRCKRHRFNPWVGMIWRRKWQATPVFLPGKFLGLVGYSPWSCKESDMIEWLRTHAPTYIHVSLCGHFPSTWLHIRSGIVALYGNFFLITNDVECLLCAYWPLVYFLFWCVCLIFYPFFWVVFLLSFKSSLYILDTNPLSDVDIYMPIHIDVDIYMSCQINIFIPVSVLPFKFC